MSEEITVQKLLLPLVPLRGLNVFPRTLFTFDVERKSTVAAMNLANKNNRLIFLAGEKDPTVDVPEAKDFYAVGVVAKIRQQLQPPGTQMCRVMVEGLYRAKAEEITGCSTGFMAAVVPLQEQPERISAAKKEALVRSNLSLYEEYLQLVGEFTPEQMLGLFADPEPSYISDFLAQHVQLGYDQRQILLEELHPCKRLELLTKMISHENDILSLEKELNDAASESMNKTQRDYFLREEMRIIQSELGEEGSGDEIEEYREKVEKLPVSDEVREKLLKEVGHLAKQPYGSSEAAVIRSYLDTCLELPWGKTTKETIDIEKARRILDKEHYGLEKVKERILEYLAVRQLTPEVKGGLLCLVGPPGTGKTSVAMSIARATNRKLVRVSLGGVHDEAEIRGHRKTYIGSMPGRIINGMVQAGSMNPLMVLDEIDKLGSDYRGDPSAALLEVFDREQNSTFRDNFLEIPFDLSNIFFITTANSLSTIPPALLDRMEIIELPSYTDEEKVHIAKKYLLPKQRKIHGLTSTQLKVNDAAIRAMIAGYTRESGVRLLEREAAKLCRKAASGIAEEKFTALSVTPDKLHDLLGPVRYKPEEDRKRDMVGLVRGLAYTSVGGEVLDVEVAVVPGTGKIEVTGNLGDVMKESAHIAVTCIRSRAEVLGIASDFYKTKDIHIHFPEGAVPKDGPSAGITMCTAIASALTDVPVRHDIAMTGEITLRGRVLPIGGLREKTMGALRAGVKTILIPEDNVSDLEEIDPLVRVQLNFIPVKTIDEVLSAALAGRLPSAQNGSFRLPGKAHSEAVASI